MFTLGAALQIFKLRRNFEAQQKEVENYREDHYKLFEEGAGSRLLLDACKGDQEQIERVLYGAGLY